MPAPERPGTSLEAPSRPSAEASERRDRAAERAGAAARDRRGRRARVALSLAAVGAAVWAGWFSPLFALDASKVSVVGAGGSVDEASVIEAVSPYVGTPLPRLDLGSIVDAVSGLDGVRSATATRAWPDGVTVAVEARVAIAAVPDGTGAFTLVDADGVALGAPQSAPGALPVVDVPIGEEYARALGAVISVLAQLPTELGQRVESAGAQTEDTVVLTLGDGTVLQWGSADQTALKASVVLTLLGSGSVNAAVIDVSAPTLPVTHN